MKTRDCVTCGNCRVDEGGMNRPVVHWICRQCQGDRSFPGPRESLWHPRGTILVMEEVEVKED